MMPAAAGRAGWKRRLATNPSLLPRRPFVRAAAATSAVARNAEDAIIATTTDVARLRTGAVCRSTRYSTGSKRIVLPKRGRHGYADDAGTGAPAAEIPPPT